MKLQASTHGGLQITQPWFVCQSKPRQERVAQANLLIQGYEVYLPLLHTWQRRGGHWQRTEQIMFPRYAFVRPTRGGQSIAPVRSTPGVSNLVRFGSVLGCMSADRLDALRLIVDSRANAMPHQPFAEGASVSFVDGPFKGLSGLVSNVAAERVMVLMSLLGREQRVTVPIEQLALA